MPYSKFRFVLICGRTAEFRSAVIMQIMSRLSPAADITPDKLARDFTRTEADQEKPAAHEDSFARFLEHADRRLKGLLSIGSDIALICIDPSATVDPLAVPILEMLADQETRGILLVDLDGTSLTDPDHPFYGKRPTCTKPAKDDPTSHGNAISELIPKIQPPAKTASAT